LGYISEKHPEVAARATNDMEKVNFESCRLLGTNYFNGPQEGSKEAEINFVVVVTGNAKRLGSGTGNVRVTLNLEKVSEGNWKIINYHYENPQAGLKL